MQKNTSEVLECVGNSSAQARLLKAFSRLAADAGEAPKVSGMYGQIRRITVGGMTLSSESEFDIDFEIPFDDDAEINESVISIYNLSATTAAQFREGSTITVDAGYKNDSVGQVLNGKIVSVRTYWDDVDRITEITAQDYNGTADTKLKNDISYAKKTSASHILKDLCGRLGIPIAVFQLARDFTFKNAVKVNGSLMDNIRKYAKVCGVSAWINKSALYICPLATPISEGYFDLNANTGLLSVETWQEKEENEDFKDTIDGVTVKMLLQHRIYTGCTLQITSKNVNGRFKVREGQHDADDNDFTTTVKAVRM